MERWMIVLVAAIGVHTLTVEGFTCPGTNLTAAGSSVGLTLRIPATGCSQADCDVYVTMAPNTFNSSFLDIYMEGTAAGWVAVGFSDTAAMSETDALGCRMDSGNTVVVVNTWNPLPNYSPNQLDPNQDGVCTHTTSFTGGRISCLFSRYSGVINPGRDVDLNATLFIIYGRRMAASGMTYLAQHAETPSRTSSMVNPFALNTSNASNASIPSVGSSYPRRQLIQTHGILMLIAWPMLASVGIFFASWMKPALPNGEWFQTHRALLICSLFVNVVGFIFAFVANARQNPPGLVNTNNATSVTHMVFGILVLVLQIANPLIALLRCKPDDSNRWIFNLTHAFTIGLSVELLAFTNIGLGLALFGVFGSFSAFWIFIAYIVCIVILEVVLHIVFTVSAMNASPEERNKLAPTAFRGCFSTESANEGVELKDKTTEEEEKPVVPAKKSPSKDAWVRWVALGVHLCVVLLIVVVAIVVAVGQT